MFYQNRMKNYKYKTVSIGQFFTEVDLKGYFHYCHFLSCQEFHGLLRIVVVLMIVLFNCKSLPMGGILKY